ncbi:SRPBCC domain-containing protein [Paeniglutamicibacter psychrophenolicus]|uniref:SRPBCC domain-containing protein n=1 Tax=Paeniglutamicibacter psychrophenolicus TaxID=257454 RepID=UPI00277F6D78|nr:SRPBCC domain-containing protein [Paeniglutamicibacter psychrophenolicus]MDQ0094509.1 uncharacterized protein YndB with AHSA1/START domain [Paeniglutamicibacter psychrophenolicus]
MKSAVPAQTDDSTRPVHATLTFSATMPTSPFELWDAFADASLRAAWSVPEGDQMVYDQSQFFVGGRDGYRCGPKGNMNFDGRVEYLKIVPGQLLVHTDMVHSGGTPLSAALLTWSFVPAGHETRLDLTVQVTSFVGAAMIEGNRNGHGIALAQLAVFRH